MSTRLRHILAELSLELNQAKEELVEAGRITRLPNPKQRTDR
jgi:hypothetical protein